MRLDVTAKTLILTAVLVMLVGAIRSGTVTGAHLPETFWAQKLLWPPEFDAVVAGDSRVYRGVSPGAMETQLPGMRIANFGFSSCALTKPYLDAVESLLDPHSPQPTIILGVTANTLTPVAAKENGFLKLRRMRRFELLQLASLDRLLFFFNPYDLEEARNLFRKDKTGYTIVWHPDGWVESRKVPEDPTEAVRVYRRQVKRDRWQARVSERLVQDLLLAVHAWRQRGIVVYGFRPPTPQAMVEFETAWMQFDEPAFVERFREAGGVWLPFDAERYHSYDGSHLRDDAAVAFSKDLARSIQPFLLVRATGRSERNVNTVAVVR